MELNECFQTLLLVFNIIIFIILQRKAFPYYKVLFKKCCMLFGVLWNGYQ